MSAGSLLRKLAAPASAPPDGAEEERCEMCGELIAPTHRHLLDLQKRQLLCACRACSLLFDRSTAGGIHYRLVPDRCLRIADFDLDDVRWNSLSIPVGLAFVFDSSAAERPVAFYPGPMGATESALKLETWSDIVERNPVLAGMEPDVEALLVNRAKGEHDHWLVGVDKCYELVGLIRTRWRGFAGGEEVWQEIEQFFDGLRGQAKAVTREGERLR
ncbi:MAG: hypothetical protein QOJ13_3171 [Gaiellales bacterium]|jgi:hypothetical protein|nr:hypothetical protein [Gaiellales bacterium]